MEFSTDDKPRWAARNEKKKMALIAESIDNRLQCGETRLFKMRFLGMLTSQNFGGFDILMHKISYDTPICKQFVK